MREYNYIFVVAGKVVYGPHSQGCGYIEREGGSVSEWGGGGGGGER